jgi:hypothetical protein
MESNILKYDQVRREIKDGDVLLYKGKGLFRSGFIPTLVQLVTQSPYAHAGIAVWWNERLMVIEAIGKGVIVNPLSLSLERYHATVEWWCCKEEIPNEKRREMILYAQEVLGKSYATLLAFWFMIKMLFVGNFDKSDRFREETSLYCSQFVAQVYHKVGLDLKKGRSDRYMSPGDIAKSGPLVYRGTLQR